MDRLATDILGPFPVSSGGNRYVLLVMDEFTKYVEAYAIPDQTAKTVAYKIAYDFISRYGVPLDIHSDQGRDYESELFKQCNLLDIHKTRSSPFRPLGNSMVERYNRTLVHMISAYVNENQLDWDEHLPLLTSAYRSCRHESTGYTPNMLMYGREVHIPIQLVMGGVTSDTEENGDNTAEFVTKLKDKMLRVHELCREHLQKSLERERRDYDTRISINNYEVGDLVYALDSTKTVGKSYKLKSDRWKGPLVIVRKISDLLFEVRGPPKTKPKVLHHDRLKPYLSEDRPPWIQTLRDKLHKVPTTKETVELTTLTTHDADAAETKKVPSPQDTPEPDVRGKETIPVTSARMDTHTAKVKAKDSCQAIPVSKLATWQEQGKAPEIPTNVSNTTVNKSLNKRISLWKRGYYLLKG